MELETMSHDDARSMMPTLTMLELVQEPLMATSLLTVHQVL